MGEPAVAWRWVKSLGVVTCVCALFGLAGAVAHRWSALPERYTWGKPLDILLDVSQQPHFPVAALGAYLLGVLARVGWRGARGALGGREWLAPAARPRLARAALVGAAFGLASGLFSERYGLADRAACFGIGAVLARHLADPAELKREAAQLAYVGFLFLVVSYGFTVFKALLFARGVPSDELIVELERSLWGFAPHEAAAAWGAAHPSAVRHLDRIYYRLFDHMALASVFLVGLRWRTERNELLASLAFAYVIGGPAYHLLPALGPAFFDPESYRFLLDQRLISNGFRERLLANTVAAASGRAAALDTYEYLACMPSLHMAHEFVMLYYSRHSKVFFIGSLAFTTLTAAAVVVLGWHYPIDIPAGLLLAAVSIGAARAWRGALLPAELEADDPPRSDLRSTGERSRRPPPAPRP